MIRLLLLTAILQYVTSAPVIIQNAEDTPLIRTKRSEEAIIYGNHQNFARTKKASFHPISLPLSPENVVKEEPEEPKEPGMMEEMSTGPDPDKSNEERIEKLLTDTQDDIPQEEESLPVQVEQEEPEQEQGVDDKQGGEVEQEEERTGLENVAEESKNADDLEDLKSEGLSIPDPAQITEEYQIIDEPTSGDSENAIPDQDQSKYYQQEYNWDKYFNERNNKEQQFRNRNSQLPLRSNFFKLYREKRSVAPGNAAQGASKMVKAEDMNMMRAASSKLGGRVKRDLDFSSDDLEPYLDDGYYGQAEDYPNFYPEDDLVMDRRAEGPAGDWTEDEFDNYIQDPRYEVDPRSYSGPGYRLEEAPVLMDDPEERRKLEMLRYLYEQGLGLNDQEVEYPDDVEESWQDLGPAREMMYNQDPYEQPQEEEEEEEEDQGLTLPQGEQLELPPSKRQYLSFVPGNRKRDNLFYPSQYGPDGRWGALVVDPEREKRNELAEYERLYELAQALNGPGSDSRDKRYDSYIPEEAYDDYLDRNIKK